MLTTSEAARLLGVSRPRVLTLIHLGTIKAEKRGRDWQVDPVSVEAYRISERRPGRKKPTNVATSVAQPKNIADSAQHNAES